MSFITSDVLHKKILSLEEKYYDLLNLYGTLINDYEALKLDYENRNRLGVEPSLESHLAGEDY